MTAATVLAALRDAVLRRRALIAVLYAAAIALAAIPLAWRIGGGTAATIAVAALIAAVVGSVLRDRAQIDARRIARGLDDADRRFDDSAELLCRDDADLGVLASLQKQRVAAPLAQHAPDLRPPLPQRTLGLLAAAALAVGALALVWPARGPAPFATTPDANAPDGTRAATTLTSARVRIAPPAYTGLSERTEASLDTRVPEGADVGWQLAFDTRPTAVALAFHDGTRVALQADGDRWTGTHALRESVLYRIVVDGAPALAPDTLHRIDVTPDQPPEIRVLAPDKTLTLLEAGQKQWELSFEGSDDYGLGDATLTITLAQGTGENITFKERTVTLAGDGDARQRRYRQQLDLAELGIAVGDDVIVRLALADNRVPTPNTTRSASFILRWPPEASSESVGMEGLVRNALPAYFRSQRQIIIDTEALVADKPNLPDEAFVEKSDTIGVDQKILRLRYGQFLGEEFETGAAARPEAAEHDDEHAHDGEHDDAHDKQAPAADALTQHDHAPSKTTTFGQVGDVLAEFGHTHDHAEAATLLDPETKAILKAALDQMWQAERELRTGQPHAALPYEYKALEYIKQVQQATRIYLARVGLELPPVDEARRLTGDRKGVEPPADALANAIPDEAAVVALAQALADGATPDWTAFDAWLAQNGKRLPDELGLRAALDALRRDAACTDCRERVRALLWPALPAPAAATTLRAAPDAAGRAYLDALRREAMP